MTDTQWWTGILGGTAAWLLLYTYPDVAVVGDTDLFLPIILALGPVVALSIFMDARALHHADEAWQPNPYLYAVPSVLFPAVVGPLYLFLRLIRVEMQDTRAQEEDGSGTTGENSDGIEEGTREGEPAKEPDRDR